MLLSKFYTTNKLTFKEVYDQAHGHTIPDSVRRKKEIKFMK